jgi:hypothetical protein
MRNNLQQLCNFLIFKPVSFFDVTVQHKYSSRHRLFTELEQAEKEIRSFTENDKFKFKITLDRHMSEWSWITVFFLTPLIFRDYLLLKGFYFTYEDLCLLFVAQRDKMQTRIHN